MKTCKQIRYENARALAADGPADFARRVSDVSEKAMSGQQANQIIGPNANRGIGDDVARRIEKAYEKEEGWLDHEWGDQAANSGAIGPLSAEAKSLILCVERLDGLGELAHKTFAYHTGLLQVSAAAAELQTTSARAQMLEQIERTLSPRFDIPGNQHGKQKK
jgi:hypothetical protein